MEPAYSLWIGVSDLNGLKVVTFIACCCPCCCLAVAKEQVTNVHLPKERHDYGINKRQANYDFFIRVFGLDRSKLDESKVKVEKPEVLQSVIR